MALNLICNADDPQQDGALISFDSQGAATERDFVRGDINLAVNIRPVKESLTGLRPWDDDFQTGDTFELAIGNPDQPPTGGTFDLTALGGTVTSSSVANPSVITHAVSAVTLASGNTVYISGHTGSTPDINGAHVITVTSSTTFTIPVNVTVAGTGGNFYLASTGLASLPYNITVGALATALTVAPLTAPTVTLLADGVYDARWASGVSAPTFASPTNALAPASFVSIIDDSEGTVQVRIINLKQEPVAYAEPATLFPAAGVTATVEQAGSGSANKIYTVSFDAPGTYGGSYSLTFTGVGVSLVTAGVFTPSSTATQIQTALEDIAAVGDFLVTQDTSGVTTIELTGTQALSNVPVITAININLLAPLGVSGVIALNTTNLYRAFWNVPVTTETLDFTMEVRRTRVTGESGAIFQHSVTLKRNLIDGVIIPTVLASYYTTAQTYSKAQVDALLAALPSVGTIAIQDANAVAITGGTEDSVTYTNGLYDGLSIDTSSGVDLSAGTTDLSFGVGAEVLMHDGSILVIATNKHVTFSQSLTFTGSSGSTLNIGGGGTLGTAAFTDATAYSASGDIASSGLTQSTARLLGRTTASTGAIEQITVGAGLTFMAGNLSVTNAYDPAAVAITSGTIAGVTVSATTLAASSLASLLGGLKLTYAQKTSTYSMAATDFAIESTSGTFTVTAVTAVGRIGQMFLLKNSGAGVITWSTTGGQTFDGLSTLTLTQGTSYLVQSNGANWVIVGAFGGSATGSFTTLTASGAVTFTAGTASSSTTTGTLIVTGGVGVSGSLFAGGTISAPTITGTTLMQGQSVESLTHLNAINVGFGLTIKGGTSGRLGSAVLVGGTKVVTCTNIAAGDFIFLQRITAGGTLGAGGYTYTISAGASFTINSVDTAGVLSILDTSTIGYLVVKQT